MFLQVFAPVSFSRMKHITVTLFIGIILICSSCVSKKKYLACENTRNSLENLSIRQYKTIDTLKVEIQKKQKQIETLEKDTLFKSRNLQHIRHELENVQNLLTSSKKQLNDQMQDMQIKDRYIQQIQLLYQKIHDSILIYQQEFSAGLDSLITTDSCYKEVILTTTEDQIRVYIPESFFFTGSNRNFISTKGKAMTQLLADVLQKHPYAQSELLMSVPPAASTTLMKEQTDKACMRLSSIYRSLQYDNGIGIERLRATIENREDYPEHICFCILTNMQSIFKTIKTINL